MSPASNNEVQAITNELLAVIGHRPITGGSIEIHFSNDGLTQKVEVHTIPWRRRAEDQGLVRR